MQGTFLGNIVTKSSLTNQLKIFPHRNVKSAIPTSIFLNNAKESQSKTTTTTKTFFGGFMLKSNWNPYWLFALGQGYFPVGKFISWKSGHTHHVNLPRSKGSFNTVKVSPVTAPIIESLHAHFILTMSSFSLYPFTLIILKIPLSPAHICCWYPTQLSNAIQHNSYLHQHIPRKRNQASSCYGQKFKEIDFSALVTRWSIFPDRRS